MRRVIAALALCAGGCASLGQQGALLVPAAFETAPVGQAGDAADDPAIWVAPDPARSLIIGTQKKGGLQVYDLTGALLQDAPGGLPNNIDVRDGFAWPEGEGPIFAASDRSDQAVTFFRLDPRTGALDPAPRFRLPSGFAEVYGVCLARGAAANEALALATSKIGEVRAWRVRLVDGAWSYTQIADFALGSIAEGCVIDEDNAIAYVAQELVGLWRMPLADPSARTLMDRVGAGLAADVEGVALTRGPRPQDGFVLVSVQGQSRYAVYDRAAPNAYRGSFRIGPGGGADGASGTDGIDVVAAPLNAAFPQGLFVAQDDENTDPAATQNFKLVSWGLIAQALGLDPERD